MPTPIAIHVSFLHRSHHCGEVNTDDVGTAVNLYGWVEYKRGNKFFTLRDATGSCQILCNIDVNLPSRESVVAVEGTVQLRPEKDVNLKMATGKVEICCAKLKVLNRCSKLAFTPNVFTGVKEETRMRYRYLDIRSKVMQHNLRLRSSFLLKVRKYLCEEKGFVDVETPTLFRRTPGGAQEFVVPTQRPGMFYSLPQSPQQFKQLLMAGGIDRYMQIARCYRDEGAKPDRQPEFTQLDLELSFCTQQQIMSIIEDMLVQSWPEHLPKLKGPFSRMSHHTAIEKYGVDKPDTRFESTIKDLTGELSHLPLFSCNGKRMDIRGLNIEGGTHRLKSSNIKYIQQTVENLFSAQISVVKIGMDGSWHSPLAKYAENDVKQAVSKKLSASPNDLLFISCEDSWESVCTILGKCRSLAARLSADNGQPLHDDNLFNFLWIENFPLFEKEDNRIVSAHHPFTAPVDEDSHLLTTNPLQVRGQHYDLVLNGSEVGGGSIRIHNASMQRYVLESVLNEDASQLEHLLEALDSGCPPHGGIALGLDRLLSIMCDAPSIRDVIAFPKSHEGLDLMSGAPNNISQEDLDRYNIAIVEKNI